MFIAITPSSKRRSTIQTRNRILGVLFAEMPQIIFLAGKGAAVAAVLVAPGKLLLRFKDWRLGGLRLEAWYTGIGDRSEICCGAWNGK